MRGMKRSAGWVAASAADLPAEARDYVAAFAGPYYEAMARWLGLLRIGTPGDELARLIQEALPAERFGITLNAGHLIHLDEWLSSPIYRGSRIPLHSGMVVQVDVIPASPRYGSARLEDGVALADASLQAELRDHFAACWARCQARRAFMEDTLGITLAPEALPLSNIAGIMPPFLLSCHQVLALEP